MRPVKLLFGVDANRCVVAQVSASIDGVVRAPFMQRTPPVIIVSPLPADGAQHKICITLRTPCPSLWELCYGSPHCRYSLLDTQTGDSCCAVGST